MADLKTKQNESSVEDFLNSIPDERRRKDCFTVMEMMRQVTGYEPKMWGDAMVGFGVYHYTYASGHEGDTFHTGFSPRKQNLALYLGGNIDQQSELMQRLGKHKLGKACLYINKLSDIDLQVLRELIERSIKSG